MFEAPALTARGVSLRAARDGDAPFLRTLFESARSDAAILTAWPDAARRAFLDQQFRFQTTHYARVYADADRLLVLEAGEPIGRLILSCAAEEWCIVDVALLPRWRGQGIGTWLLQSIQAAAVRDAAPCVRLSVDIYNPARRLYERLGFTTEEEAIPNIGMIWRPDELN